MAIAQLTEGDHVIKWILNGYETLIAVINVSSAGVITCRSVADSSCSAAAPPRVTISGVIVTGHLRAAATPTPTPIPATPTPIPAPPLCTWIAGKGGPTNLRTPDIIDLEYAYLGFGDLGFTPTIDQIVGVVYYYLGFTGDGNTKTRCSY